MKKRVLSALLALCLTLSLAGAAFAENEPSGDSSSAASQAVSSAESESQAQDKAASSSGASNEEQTAAKNESTPAPTETPAASDVTEEEPESTVAPEATEEPEATATPDATPAPTEDPVADVTENEESDGSVEYSASLETDGQTMNVVVTAPEGAFAEGVQPKLSVTMLTAEDELNTVAGELDAAEVQYDGFAALDITFTDGATGMEVEPVKSVAVRIELPQAMVDSGIDLTTLAVQHLEEDADGNVQNVTEVATLDNGITLSEEAAAAVNEAAGVAPMSDMPAEEATAGDATETPAAVAEFSVDGFSWFTITWGYGYDKYVQVVDENYQDIGETNRYDSFYIGNNWTDVKDIAEQIISSNNLTGYSFQRAVINKSIEISSLKNYSYDYDLWYYSVNGDEGRIRSRDTIYFVFNKSSDVEGGIKVENNLKTADTVDSIGEGVHMYLFNYDNANGPFTGGEYDNDGNDKGHVTQGLASKKTQGESDAQYFEKFPELTTAASPTSGYGRSFSSFFNPEEGTEVNNLFLAQEYNENGTFYYSAFDNFATIIEDDCAPNTQYPGVRNFKVYNALGSPEYSVVPSNSASDAYFFYQRGNFLPYNTLDEGDQYTHKYYDENGQKISGNNQVIYGLIDKNGNKVQRDTGAEYQFGMYMYASFYQPKDGLYNGQEMIYNFTGDDDLWVYIDGVLVLDLGGEHDALSGSINFTTGKVEYQTYANATGSHKEETTIKELFDNAQATQNTRWDENTFADGTSHTIQMFYMERGGGASNLKMSFNLPTIPDGTLSVKKEVENYFDAQMKDITYKMELTDTNDSPMGNVEYYLMSDPDKKFHTGTDGTFNLGHDETAVFEKLAGGQTVKVKEIDVIPENEHRLDDYSVSYEVKNSSDQIVDSGDGNNKPIVISMPAAGNASVTIKNSATFTAPLVVKKNFEGTTSTLAPEGFDADFAVYAGTLAEGEPIGSVNYSDFVDGSYTFWLEEGKTYTVVETIKNEGQTGSDIKYLYTTVVTHDNEEDSESQKGTSASVVIEQGSNQTGADAKTHEIVFTNVYGEPTGTLLITKTVTGIDEADASKLNQIKFTVSGEELENPIEKTLAEFTRTSGSYTYTIEIPDLTPGDYTVTESNTTVGGYDRLDTSSDPTKITTVSAGQKASVSFTNDYKHSDTYLTISKDVTGGMGDTSKSFGFTLTLHKENEGSAPTYYVESLPMDEAGTTSGIYEENGLSVTTGADADGHTYHFSLANDQTIKIQVPYGYIATVTESNDGYTTTTTLDENEPEVNNTQVMAETTSNHSIKYENRRDPVAPTGLEDNHTKPFGLMVGIAVMAGLALVGGAVVRRRRRWME